MCVPEALVEGRGVLNRSARVLGVIGAAGLVGPMAMVAAIQPAAAHGAMDEPISRSYACYQDNPENPASDVCQAVVDVGGPQPLYDWNEVNIADAAGRHREIIPDGELCSAGRDKYAGLDLARADWPTTSIPAGEDYEFRYLATAPHQGGWELYVTKDGYDPTQPLGWDDLEAEPFLTVDNPELVDGHYVMPATLPDKSGRHLIYAIWQRTDSPEAFYACSDVVFEGGSGGDPTPPPDPDPTEPPEPTQPPEPTEPPEPSEPPEPTEPPQPSEPPEPTEPPGPELPDELRQWLLWLYEWLGQWLGDDAVDTADTGDAAHHGHEEHGSAQVEGTGSTTDSTTTGEVVMDHVEPMAATTTRSGQPFIVGGAAVLFGLAAVLARPGLLGRREPGHRRRPAHRRIAKPLDQSDS